LRISSPENRRFRSHGPGFRLDTSRRRPLWFRSLPGRFRPSAHVGLTTGPGKIRGVAMGAVAKSEFLSPIRRTDCGQVTDGAAA
jgi:hypothetical protein